MEHVLRENQMKLNKWKNVVQNTEDVKHLKHHSADVKNKNRTKKKKQNPKPTT